VLAGALVWLLILHLINLMRALVHTACEASWWLAPTPLAPPRFALALCHRALLAQSAVWVLLIGLAYVIAGSAAARTSALIGALGLAVASGLGITLSVLALRGGSKAESMVYRWRR
jgi:hypothetical protein